ncbi:MAG: hypothetical protein DELT_00521 [Desulfovibrio sp.]
MKLKVLFTVFFVFLFVATGSRAAEWYEGGTLHTVTVAQWNKGSSHDKIATAGDWVAYHTAPEKLRSVDADLLREAATAVAICVDKSTDGIESVQNQQVTQFALLCMTMMQKSYPFFLTKQ